MSDLPIILSGIRRELEMLSKTVGLITKIQSQRLAEEFNRKKKAALILGCSIRTLDKLISSGNLPITRVGGLIFIKTSDIERMLNEHYDNHSSTLNPKSND